MDGLIYEAPARRGLQQSGALVNISPSLSAHVEEEAAPLDLNINNTRSVRR